MARRKKKAKPVFKPHPKRKPRRKGPLNYVPPITRAMTAFMRKKPNTSFIENLKQRKNLLARRAHSLRSLMLMDPYIAFSDNIITRSWVKRIVPPWTDPGKVKNSSVIGDGAFLKVSKKESRTLQKNSKLSKERKRDHVKREKNRRKRRKRKNSVSKVRSRSPLRWGNDDVNHQTKNPQEEDDEHEERINKRFRRIWLRSHKEQLPSRLSPSREETEDGNANDDIMGLTEQIQKLQVNRSTPCRNIFSNFNPKCQTCPNVPAVVYQTSPRSIAIVTRGNVFPPFTITISSDSFGDNVTCRYDETSSLVNDSTCEMAEKESNLSEEKSSYSVSEQLNSLPGCTDMRFFPNLNENMNPLCTTPNNQ